ncbi:hypothetical protein BD560DRAFT_417363 [Blakeslea trispora]|nr:hypothetical protein BD560DRAFT_417363 [Blakeslea trispora]
MGLCLYLVETVCRLPWHKQNVTICVCTTIFSITGLKLLGSKHSSEPSINYVMLTIHFFSFFFCFKSISCFNL